MGDGPFPCYCWQMVWLSESEDLIEGADELGTQRQSYYACLD